MAHEMNGEKCTTCNYADNKTDNVPSEPTETTPDSTAPQQQEKGNGGMPWWSLLLIGLGAVVVGVIVGVFVLKQKKKV
jgi:ABC-type branched-subunit amino acid transport system permease subunit